MSRKHKLCPVCGVMHHPTTVQKHIQGEIRPTLAASALARGRIVIPDAQAALGLLYEAAFADKSTPLDPMDVDVEELAATPTSASETEEALPASVLSTPEAYASAAAALNQAAETMRANSQRQVSIEEVPNEDDVPPQGPSSEAGEEEEEEEGQDGPYDLEEDDKQAVRAWMEELENEWRREHQDFGMPACICSRN